MNDSSLMRLTGRWPNDTIDPTTTSIVAGLAQPGNYIRNLRIDPQDQHAIIDFANDNGYVYMPQSMERRVVGGLRPAWMNNSSTKPMRVHEVSMRIDGFSVRTFLEYQDVTASRNWVLPGSARMGRRSVVEVSLPATFPQLIINSKVNDDYLYMDTTFTNLPRSTRMHLEGPFETYYKLYAPKGLQIDILTLLAPNFMQMLIDSAGRYDVELFGETLTFITQEPIYEPAVMKETEAMLHEQLLYMQRILRSWKYVPRIQPFDLVQGSGLRILGKHSSSRVWADVIAIAIVSGLVLALLGIVVVFILEYV